MQFTRLTHARLLEQALSCEQQLCLSHWVQAISEEEIGQPVVVVPPNAVLQLLLRQIVQVSNEASPAA